MTFFTLRILGGLLAGIVVAFYLMSKKGSLPWTWRATIDLMAVGMVFIVLTIAITALVGWLLGISFHDMADDLTTTFPMGIGLGLVLVAIWLLMLERIEK